MFSNTQQLIIHLLFVFLLQTELLLLIYNPLHILRPVIIWAQTLSEVIVCLKRKKASSQVIHLRAAGLSFRFKCTTAVSWAATTQLQTRFRFVYERVEEREGDKRESTMWAQCLFLTQSKQVSSCLFRKKTLLSWYVCVYVWVKIVCQTL